MIDNGLLNDYMTPLSSTFEMLKMGGQQSTAIISNLCLCQDMTR